MTNEEVTGPSADAVPPDGPPDEFRMLIDEPRFSLVLSQGDYLGDLLLSKDKSDEDNEAWLAGCFRRVAQEFGLQAADFSASPSGWVSVLFLKTEGN